MEEVIHVEKSEWEVASKSTMVRLCAQKVRHFEG